MKAELVRSNRNRDGRVVVMSSEKVSWYRVNKKQSAAICFLTEPLVKANIDVPDSLLPNDGVSHRVEIIVDTSLDDLDRVRIVESMPRALRSLNVIRTILELRREYPTSEIFKLPEKYYPNIASVLHTQLPEKCLLAIDRLQRKGLVISHLTTSAQLIRMTNQFKGACLYNLPCGAAHVRHMIFHDFALIFMRIKKVESGDRGENQAAAVQTSLNYVAESDLLGGEEFPILSPFYHADEALEVFDFEKYLATTYVTAAARVSQMSELEDFKTNEEFTVDTELKLSVNRKQRFAKQAGKLCCALNLINRQSNSFWDRYRVNGKLLDSLGVLEPSRTLLRSHSRLILLRNITFALVVFTLMVVLTASFHGVQQVRTLTALSKQRGDVELEKEQILVELNTLNEKPFLIAETLKRNQEFSQNNRATPTTIMTLIASFLKGFPSLKIDSLSWSLLPVYADNETVVTNVENLASRTQFIQDALHNEKLQVTLSGFIENSEPLREQQSLLEEFTLHLSKSSLISNLIVMASPVDSAIRSETDNERGGKFSVQFVVIRP